MAPRIIQAGELLNDLLTRQVSRVLQRELYFLIDIYIESGDGSERGGRGGERVEG